ncbi:MAG: helix-turn-helix domain-containing protein [Thermoleophilaceae bacterium]
MAAEPRQISFSGAGVRRIRLLEDDVGLGEGLPRERLTEAERQLTAPAIELSPGRWRFETDPPGPAALGLIVVDGLVGRTQFVGKINAVEFLGPGDVVRPWTYGSEQISALPVGASWEVFRTSTVALLDDDFSRRAAQWPEVAAAVVERVVARSRSLAFSLAVRQLVRVDERVLLTLWYLADRWGRIRTGGRTLPLPELSHEVLGRMVSARRPSVTTALGRLRERGLVERHPDGSWILHGEPPADIEQLRVGSDDDGLEEVDEPTSIGESGS